MKTMLILCFLALSISAVASDDKAVTAIVSAVPDAKSIEKTSDGYRVRTDAGTVFVEKTSYGYRVQGGNNSAFITKTSDGYRITPR
jgi:regulation of enolase protein 1 (concanavalin A-like superfamily)